MKILVYLYSSLMLLWTFWLSLLFWSLGCNRFSRRPSFPVSQWLHVLFNGCSSVAGLFYTSGSSCVSLQDSDRDWSGHPPHVPGRTRLSEQKASPVGFSSSMMGYAVPRRRLVCLCVLYIYPTVSFNNKKKVFGVKYTCLSWFLHFSQNKQKFFSPHADWNLFHLLFFIIWKLKVAAEEAVDGNVSAAELCHWVSCCGSECTEITWHAELPWRVCFTTRWRRADFDLIFPNILAHVRNTRLQVTGCIIRLK